MHHFWSIVQENAVLLDSFSLDNVKSHNSLLMHSLYSIADIGNGPEVIKLYVEEMNDPNNSKTAKRAYQLQNIEKYQTPHGGSQRTVSLISASSGNVYTVADLFRYVKAKDSSFKPRSVNPIFLNADGTPKRFYHGTPNGTFTVERCTIFGVSFKYYILCLRFIAQLYIEYGIGVKD